MQGVVAAVLLVLSFSFTDVLWKMLRMRNVSTRAIPALFVFSVPVLALIGIALVDMALVRISGEYLLYVALFLGGNLALNLMNIYLFRYVSLTEMFSYRKSIALFFAVLADALLFDLIPTPRRIAAISLMFVGSVLLTQRSKSGKKPALAFSTIISFLLVIGLLDTGLFTVYKMGMEMQGSILFHMILVQSTMFITFALVGLGEIRSALRKTGVKEVGLLNVLIIIGAIAEVYALHYYSISSVVLISAIPFGIFSFYDVRTKEWTLKPKNVGSLALIVIGFVLLNL